MKRVIAVLSMLIMMVSLASCKTKTLADGVFTIGLECAYAPFNWTSQKGGEDAVLIANSGFLGFGKSYCRGYDIKMATHIASELGYTLQVRKISWEGLIPALQTGHIDAIIAGMTDTPSRRESVDFTSPYYESELVMVVRKASEYASATSIEAFSGARVAAQIGTVQNDLIQDFADDSGEEDDLYVPGLIAATAYETYPDALMALRQVNAGIDGVLAERPIGEAMLEQFPDELALVEFINQDETYDENFIITVSVALRKQGLDNNLPQEQSLLARINAILATLNETTRLEWMEAAVLADKD